MAFFNRCKEHDDHGSRVLARMPESKVRAVAAGIDDPVHGDVVAQRRPEDPAGAEIFHVPGHFNHRELINRV